MLGSICYFMSCFIVFFFFFNDTATTEIYTLSLHDALPTSRRHLRGGARLATAAALVLGRQRLQPRDRKSTRLNSSHITISYAVFCLKKKKKKHKKTKQKKKQKKKKNK